MSRVVARFADWPLPATPLFPLAMIAYQPGQNNRSHLTNLNRQKLQA